MSISKKYENNLRRVQNILDDKHERKVQVGVGDQEVKPTRKVGDKWFDSEGIEWEQKEGYYSKIGIVNVGLFHQQCDDCDRNCSLSKMHQDTYNRFEKCYYCQMNFEIKLQSYPGKWEAWVRLQQLNNMDVIEKDMVQALEEDNTMDAKIRKFDESVSNSLANWETEQSMTYNKKLTGQ